ncbi:MAG: hypothetical protein WAT81_02180 [Candidatus Moraniibacteriota bacterium]
MFLPEMEAVAGTRPATRDAKGRSEDVPARASDIPEDAALARAHDPFEKYPLKWDPPVQDE